MLATRLRTHHLTGPGLPGPVDVVSWYGAMQAQDFPGVLWAIAQRVAQVDVPTEADLLAAFDAGAFIRTHILRPTWHVVVPADLRWMLALSGPRVQAANAHGYKRLEITAAERLKAERILQRTLEGGTACTRHEVADALRRGRISPDGQRLVYLLIHAELEGLICSGPRRGRAHTYTLLDARVPRTTTAVTRDEALARLVTRYVTAHGPATVKDCAWWSGLTLRDVRDGLALAGRALTSHAADDDEYWVADAAAATPRAQRRRTHLLPNFDEYTVGYRDRAALLYPGTPVTSASQMALLSQPVMIDGRLAGWWKRTLNTRASSVRLECRMHGGERVKTVEHDVQRAADAFGRFLGRSATTVFTYDIGEAGD